MYIRIISRLDIKNGILVKGIGLEGLRNLGDQDTSQIFITQKILMKFISRYCCLTI